MARHGTNREASETQATRRLAPEITVAERDLAAQEALARKELDEADRLIRARVERGIFDYASAGIEFTNPELEGRWYNEAVNSQQIFRARQKGWVPVRPTMVKNLDQLGVYSVDASGCIVRGQRGEEHLMCMTKANRRLIAQKKNAENERRMGSTRRVKTDIVSAAESALGPEAAEWIEDHTFGEITDSREPIERMPVDD